MYVGWDLCRIDAKGHVVASKCSQNTPEGYYIASASKDGKPMLRQGETGDWYGTFEGHKGAVWSCVLDTPALKCATGSADFSARIWDACAGNQLHEFQHKHIVRCVSFSYDTTRLVTGGKSARDMQGDCLRPVTERQGQETQHCRYICYHGHAAYCIFRAWPACMSRHTGSRSMRVKGLACITARAATCVRAGCQAAGLATANMSSTLSPYDGDINYPQQHTWLGCVIHTKGHCHAHRAVACLLHSIANHKCTWLTN